MMSLLGLVLLLIVIGLVLPLVPIDETIRKSIIVVVVVIVILWVIGAVGGFSHL